VGAQQLVEQDLVVVLQRPEVDVLGDVRRLFGKRAVRARDLLVERLDRCRQQTAQPESSPFAVRERGPAVVEWIN
jgi:hypothetical protein